MNYAELRKINVSEFVEKKQDLSYLSWAWAVDQILLLDPTATWEYRWLNDRPYIPIGETAMVFCTVKAFGVERTAQLPVMDYRNKPIPNPDAFQLNTAMQRCLAKAISLHGIGLYIYAGEDLPPGEEKPEDEKKNPKITPAGGVFDSMPVDVQTMLRDYSGEITGLFSRGDVAGAHDHYVLLKSDMDADQQVALWSLLDSKCRAAIKKHGTKEKASAVSQ